jgi:hypothetical protein
MSRPLTCWFVAVKLLNLNIVELGAEPLMKEGAVFLNVDNIELWWVAYYMEKKERIGQKHSGIMFLSYDSVY